MGGASVDGGSGRIDASQPTAIGTRSPGGVVEDAGESNAELESLNQWLRAQDDTGAKDGFFDVFARNRLSRKWSTDASEDSIAEACRKYPLNWSAWQALIPMLASEEEEKALDLPRDHWVYTWFVGVFQLEMQKNKESLVTFDSLSNDFPQSKLLLGHVAARRITTSESLKRLIASTKICKKSIRIASKAWTITQTCSTSRNCLQSCLISHTICEHGQIRAGDVLRCGQLFSLKSMHNKAVVYFKRALKLNPRYLSAWTLMGHEYVEMKNPAAAIDAYRHAVDINQA